MKKRNILCLFLIAASLAAFLGYRAFDRIRTDTKAPEISVGTEAPAVSVHDPKSALLSGVTATDNRDGDVTDSLVVEAVKLAGKDGTVKVSIAAFDKAGNVAKAERTLQYSDYHSPTFTLSSPLAFVESTSFEVLKFVQAEDVLDGDISHRIRASSMSESSVSSLGTHDIKLSVTNSLGDTAELVVPVEVYSAGAYSARLSLTDYLVYLPKDSVFSAQNYLDKFSFGSRTVSLADGVPEDLTLKTTGTVNTQTAGVYSVDYTVSNTYYTGYSRLIVVVEG